LVRTPSDSTLVTSKNDLTEKKETTSKSETKTEATTTPTTIKCESCNHQLRVDATFCNFCGKRLAALRRICSGCGAPLKPDIKVCILCGKSQTEKDKEKITVHDVLDEISARPAVNRWRPQ